MLAIAAGIVALISWVLAYTTVANVLGSPPPEMGTQTTTFLWNGMPRLAGHPRAWRFAFFPTKVPGAPTVRLYISPMGHLLQAEPADLDARLKKWRNVGY